MMSKHLSLLSGPLAFTSALLFLQSVFTFKAAAALATAIWMALWWIFRPCSIYVTSFVPIVVNSFFDLIPGTHVLSQYFSEIAVLLLGSDLICQTWTTTKLDQRISVKALCFIGTSMKNQVFVWFLASTVLSVFLPNVVVASIFCPIAISMLKFVGETDIEKSKTAIPILLAIGWGSGIGGLGSPIGSSANLVAISYFEKLSGQEFMYYDWVIRFLPVLSVIFVVNLIFLWLLPVPVKYLAGTKDYFLSMYASFGNMKRGEKIGLFLFVLSTSLAFIRPLFADLLPAMKPAYIFFFCGLLMFFLKDENGKVMLTWKYAESHVMWGMIFLFASGLALGRLVIETEAVKQMAALISHYPLHDGIFLMGAFCLFSVCMTELSSNTAAVSISIPVTLGITEALGISPFPYLLAAVVSSCCAYVLPVSTRAIPVGYGLNATAQMREGLKLTVITWCTVTCTCFFCMKFFPLFNGW